MAEELVDLIVGVTITPTQALALLEQGTEKQKEVIAETIKEMGYTPEQWSEHVLDVSDSCPDDWYPPDWYPKFDLLNKEIDEIFWRVCASAGREVDGFELHQQTICQNEWGPVYLLGVHYLRCMVDIWLPNKMSISVDLPFFCQNVITKENATTLLKLYAEKWPHLYPPVSGADVLSMPVQVPLTPYEEKVAAVMTSKSEIYKDLFEQKPFIYADKYRPRHR